MAQAADCCKRLFGRLHTDDDWVRKGISDGQLRHNAHGLIVRVTIVITPIND